MDEDLTFNKKIEIVKQVLANEDQDIEVYFLHLSFLRRYLGEEESNKETIEAIIEHGLIDTILSFMNEGRSGFLSPEKLDDLVNEIVLIVNGLVATTNLELLSKILDEKHGIIHFLHEILQNWESWTVLINTIMALGNIAWEIQYRDLLYKTNFGAKIKSIFESSQISKALCLEWLIAMKNFACK